jgi:hypothetical protein
MKVSVVGSSLAVISSFACQAFAFVEDDSSAASARYQQSLKQESGFLLPAPGLKVIRSLTLTPKQESSMAIAGKDVSVEVDSIGGDLRLVSGLLELNLRTVFSENLDSWISASQKSKKAKLQMGQYLSKALESYVTSNAAALKLNASDLQWNPQKFHADADHTLASFDVVVGGAVVEGASVSFRFSNGQLNQIALRTFGAARSEAAKSAGLVASQNKVDVSVSLPKILGPSSSTTSVSKGVIFVQASADGKSYEFTPAVKYTAKTAAGEPFSITQSVTSQQVLQWYSQRYQFEGHIEGKVNVRSINDGQEIVRLPYIKVSKKTGGWFGRTKTFFGDADGFLKVVGSDSAKVGLESKYFKINNNSGSNATVEAKGDVLFDSKNSTLAEVNVAHHAEAVRQFVSSYIKDSWFESSVSINVNIGDYCNAFWDGSTLNFFQAGTKKSRSGKINECSNTGEIADVIYHEYGHGIDANTGGIEDGAYSEGIGDITAMLITGSPKVGPGFFKDGGEVRNLEGDHQYPPTAAESDPHKVGLIIGSTWYHLTESLKGKYGEKDGQAKAATMFFKGLFTTSQFTDSYQATLSLNAQGGSPDKAPDFCLINKAFARHGLAKSESRCAR